MRIDPELCHAIGTVLVEAGDRPLTVRALHSFVRPYLRVSADVADVARHVAHLEGRGDLRRHADPDDPETLAYTLTQAGRTRFAN
jgi:hypothetical protein